MNDIGTACGLAERTKVRVETENVCEGHGSYSDIHYLTNLSKGQLEWIADQINCGKIAVPADKPKDDYVEPDVYEKIRNCKSLSELIELDVHLSMLRAARRAFHAGKKTISASDIKYEAEQQLQESCITNHAIKLMLEQRGQNK